MKNNRFDGSSEREQIEEFRLMKHETVDRYSQCEEGAWVQTNLDVDLGERDRDSYENSLCAL